MGGLRPEIDCVYRIDLVKASVLAGNPCCVSLVQQGTYASDSNYRWMGSIAMDKAGDMALGFSQSNSTTLHPSLAFTGRVPSDPLNTMESVASIFTAKGSVTDASRWGDYSSTVIDPSDDCTFWYVNQYMKTTLPKNHLDFHTRVASLKFPSCQ